MASPLLPILISNCIPNTSAPLPHGRYIRYPHGIFNVSHGNYISSAALILVRGKELQGRNYRPHRRRRGLPKQDLLAATDALYGAWNKVTAFLGTVHG